MGLYKFKHLAIIVEQRYGLNLDLKLLCRKGEFTYDYLDSIDVLEQLQLSPREAFASKLNDSECSPSYYIHAQNV